MTERNRDDRDHGYPRSPDRVHILSRQKIDLEPWSEQMRRSQNAGRKIVSLAIGSACRVHSHYHFIHSEQAIGTSDLAGAFSASATPADMHELKQLAEDEPRSRRLSRGVLPRSDLYVPAPVRYRARDIPGAGGNANQMSVGLESLETNPSVADSLDHLVADGAADFVDYEAVSCSVIEIEGCGGSYALQQYASRALRAALEPVRRYRVILVPSADQILNRINARGIIADLAERTTPDDTLLLFVPLDRAGPSPTDRGLMVALLTLTGSSGQHGELDESGMFALLRRMSDMVTLRTEIVPVPLTPIGRRFPWSNWRTRVLPDSSKERVRRVVGTARRMVEDDSAHVIVIAGLFNVDEVHDIKRHVTAGRQGRVHVVLNTILPEIDPHTSTATYFVVDISSKVAPSVVELLTQPASGALVGNGVNREELRFLASGIPERLDVRQMQEAVLDIQRARLS